MDKEDALKLAAVYKKLVAQHFNVKDVVLFGSYSKGTQTEDSDIDIAVVVDDLKGDYFDYTLLLWKLRRRVSSLIEPVLICPGKDKSGFWDEIKQTGILI